MKLFTPSGKPFPEVTVPVIPIEELSMTALAFTAYKFVDFSACLSNIFDDDDAYEELIDCELDYDFFHYAPWLADEKTQAKWQVSYILHELSNYNDILRDAFDDSNYYEIKDSIKRKLLDRISELYPNLKEECDRRINI